MQDITKNKQAGSSVTLEPSIYVVEEEEGMRLDRWIKKQVPNLNQSLLEKSLRAGKIRLNDQRAKSSTRLRIGDVVQVFLGPLKESSAPPKQSTVAPSLTQQELSWFESLILWEDEGLLVLNKPSGLAVQGGTKTTRHVDNYLRGYGAHRNCTYRLVHRIDRDTSGVLLVAKTQKMAAYLTACFREGQVEKIYWAVVLNHPKPGYGTVKASLTKAGVGDREKVVVDEKEGKKAITSYRTIKRLISKRLPPLTWIEAKPETGRTHQIRVHCQYLETPIIGDGKYGGTMVTAVSKTLHLHARSTTFKDPEGNRFTFVAPPPSHMVETFERYNIQWHQVA